jgi:hypothetical protein
MLRMFLIGTIGIIKSGIFIGAWTNGQQQRANFHSETEDHRNFRTKIAMISGGIGITSLVIAGLLYYFT